MEAEKLRSREAEAAGGVAVGAWSNRTPPSEGGAGKEKRWKPKAESRKPKVESQKPKVES